jgi:hypothetical protein
MQTPIYSLHFDLHQFNFHNTKAHCWFCHSQVKVFAYSVFYIFFEQYLDIMQTAVYSLVLATGTEAYKRGNQLPCGVKAGMFINALPSRTLSLDSLPAVRYVEKRNTSFDTTRECGEVEAAPLFSSFPF